MYTIHASKKIQKNLNKFTTSFNKPIYNRFVETLENNPKRARKESQFYVYEFPQGVRAVFSILEKEKLIDLLFVDKHDKYDTFLDKFKKHS